MTTEQKARSSPFGQQGKEGGAAAFRLLEHTADIGIEARAPACDQLFEQAARGLLAVLDGSGEETGTVKEMHFTVTAGDMEELLVVWLNELLYLIQSRDLWPLDIGVADIQPDSMEVKLSLAPLRSAPQREVKAVTYHHLLVHFRHGVWRARVYLDL